MSKTEDKPVSSMAMLNRAPGAALPVLEMMPPEAQHVPLAMRDGVRLDTRVWLPEGDGPFPAILLRSCYKESLLGFKRLGVLRYVAAGYALVIQMVRGIGASEGHFTFNAPEERSDGYDTVEWIAAQPWCTGAVGMDGSSYLGMTQLLAATSRPPHLRCIVPAVPSVDFFREVPYAGGVFSRLHTLNWARLLQITSLAELTGGFVESMPVLAQPAHLRRALSRPLIEAADGALTGDFRAHFRDCLAHPTFDDWWQARTLGPADYAQIDLPTLVITGHFDGSVGSLALWRGLEANAATPANRQLLIGPWDHGQCYSGGQPVMGPYQLGEASVRDLGALRITFFDRHLKGEGPGPALAARVTVFITGANEWREFAAFPPAEVTPHSLWLASAGGANTARGDGKLAAAAPAIAQPADTFSDDPAWPFVGAIAEATGCGWDLRERARDQETLVYTGDILTTPLTLLGQPQAELFTACDAPDADLFVWLSELRADGQQVKLAAGQLRLRYHAGFDAERPLTPGEPVRVNIPLSFIGHQIAAGSRLRMLVAGSNFPQADPNPHGAGPIATATTLASAVQTIFHDPARPSRLILQVLP